MTRIIRQCNLSRYIFAKKNKIMRMESKLLPFV